VAEPGAYSPVAPVRPPTVAHDQVERDRIRTALDETLFVSAGAGSGKTTTLVDRVIALVESGKEELEHIAAITFTEKAASELRDRIREELESRALSSDPLAASRCSAALEQLDRSAIGTLHAFAQRLLSEFPIEAGLPPRVEVLDEVSSGIEFEQRWQRFSRELVAEEGMGRTLLLLLTGGVRETAAKTLARVFDDNWDLVEARFCERPLPPPDFVETVRPALELAADVCALVSHCIDGDDKLYLRLLEISGICDGMRSVDDETELLSRVAAAGKALRVGNSGIATSWGGQKPAVIGAVRALEAAFTEAQQQVLQACARHLGWAVSRFTIQSARRRRAHGRLDFHDLLVLARTLLSDTRHGREVRTAVAARYRRLLLDEFQDTDPIQIDLAVRIAAAVPEADVPATGWKGIDVSPGRLFMVGDPKQSIYRFRRADIATFLDTEDRFRGGRVSLGSNFRTVSPVIDFVNELFGSLFSIPGDTGNGRQSQPDYDELRAVRLDGPPIGPAVSIVGRRPLATDATADTLRAAEAQSVARVVSSAVTEGWTVAGEDGAWRPARLGDITILVPARTSLPFLEDALESRDIAFRAESSSLVYASRPVRDLFLVMRAIDDPTDHLRVVGALRTPLLGCGDDDLWRFKVQRGGHWGYTHGQPDSVPAGDPVASSLGFLRELHRARMWLTPSELMDRVARRRRAFELGFASGRERDAWRRLRYVIDQARAWSEASNGSLREYLRWVELQAEESARLSEPILPESDHDAVRIMTIHAAKGLEFPITILSGMSTRPGRRPSAVEVFFPPDRGVEYKLGNKVSTEEWEASLPLDEQMALDERIRLLYVAATRARDHLVVSLFRKDRSAAGEGPAKMTNAELIVDALGDRVADLPSEEPENLSRERAEAVADGAGAVGARGAGRGGFETVSGVVPSLAEWEAEMSRARAVSGRPTTVAATALGEDGRADPGTDDALDPLSPAEPSTPTPATPAGSAPPDGEDEAPVPPGADPGLQKRPRDLDLPPWLKGRYGTSVGRAVHAVLQTVDLAGGQDIGPHVAAQCEAEGVAGEFETVRDRVASALSSSLVCEAAHRPHWREVYVCVPAPGGRLLEGYVDLLFRSNDGLVVVDYKTSSAGDDEAELDRRVDGYRWQGAAYAMAVEEATGEPVARVVFLFLTPAGAIERRLTDVEGTIAELRSRIEAGAESVIS
jgi:ATP-dependent helicase/nuclease subunit A